jgi:hypothetical protein
MNDPATTDLIIIRVNNLPRASGGRLTPYFLAHLFYLGHYYPRSLALPYNISRGHYLLGGRGRGLRVRANVLTHLFFTIYPAALPYNISSGHYLPCKIYCLVLACIKANIHMRLLSFCQDIKTYKRIAMQVYRFFTIIKFRAIYF